MKKILSTALLFGLVCSSFTQKTQPSQNDSSLSFQIAHLDSAFNYFYEKQKNTIIIIDTIWKNTELLKKNTKPQTFFKNFLDYVILEKCYDFFFGGEDKPGLIPFILSILGIVIGIIRLILIAIKFKQNKVNNFLRILISVLLIIISFLMFVLSNRNFRSDESLRLSILEEKIDIAHKEIINTQNMLPRVSSLEDNNDKQIITEIKSIGAQLQDINKSISDSNEKIIEKIDNKNTNSFWVISNTCLLIVLLIIIVWTNIDKFL
jgi:hypothetical protein